MNETHLKNYEQIQTEGYKWIGRNRSLKHVRAPKGSGGVGFFIKNRLYDIFLISIVDNSYDGIFGIKFKHRISDIEIFFIYLLNSVNMVEMLMNFLVICYHRYICTVMLTF